jgi:hypothetical protein
VSGYLIDAGTTISCPHGGTATMTPQATRMKLSGKPPLVVDDVSSVAGCGLNVSGSPSPCVRLEWEQPAGRVKAAGKAVLLSTSIAKCLNGAGAPQGAALVSGFQTRVRGR